VAYVPRSKSLRMFGASRPLVRIPLKAPVDESIVIERDLSLELTPRERYVRLSVPNHIRARLGARMSHVFTSLGGDARSNFRADRMNGP
jgi:hypothetical protein